MRYGASTFVWVSPFSDKALDLVDRVKEFGCDLIEICIEDSTIDPSAIRPRAERVGIDVSGL
jgi:D-psicose/D-tagatose/L-ribulose 3-epimerase